MTSTYGWVITKDHLKDVGTVTDDEAGTMGPHNIPDRLREALTTRHPAATGAVRHIFRMYDDDGILYYTGLGTWEGPADAPDEDALVGPLRDFGRPNAGAVEIRWQGHPEWNCEW